MRIFTKRDVLELLEQRMSERGNQRCYPPHSLGATISAGGAVLRRWGPVKEFSILSFVHESAFMLQAATRQLRHGKPSVGVVQIVGPISYRPSFFSRFGDGTALVDVNEALDHLERTGLQETAYKFRQVRRVKPIIAIVDCACFSAAYWLASQATEIVITPSGEVGSVGVVCLHVDHSHMLDKAGLKPTFIHVGKYKTEGNSLEPLSDDALGEVQRTVNAAYDAFVNDIVKGRGRGLTADRVRREFGEGRTVDAADAVRRGMVDRFFPATDAAYSYALTGFNDDRQRRADLDYMDFALLRHGGPEEGQAALARLRARQFDGEEQRQADEDYTRAAIAIAELR